MSNQCDKKLTVDSIFRTRRSYFCKVLFWHMDVDKFYEMSADYSISGAFALLLSLDFLAPDLLSTQKLIIRIF
jgi:hypothetical protein